MSDPKLPDTTPQFTTAEYSGTTGGDRCAACHQPITTRYYRVNNKMACESCVQQLGQQLPKDSHAAYVRGMLFGLGAAIVGMVLYAGFTIVTGFFFGYVSLAVGWLVGKAIMLGSRGIGGRRYQIAAVVLTYAAVSLAAVPIAISYFIKTKNESPAVQSRQQQPSADSQSGRPNQANPEPDSAPKPGLGAALLQLLFLGLASPFLALQDPLFGIIGLVILMVGIRIAWKITGGSQSADIHGPYNISAAASV
jgi:predicted lipid-binding transport protein (Tim44 family)